MATKIITVEVEGRTPLLMHRYPLEPEKGIDKATREEQAEYAAYRNVNGDLYVPSIALQRALVSGATYSKGKGRASLQKPVAACVQVTPMELLLGATKYEIDSRRVVVPSTKGAIVRHRPKIVNWKLKFDLEYDPELISADQMRAVVDDTGSRVGLLDFRPEKKGPFGRFMVTRWDAA